jgi:hypothetical protein
MPHQKSIDYKETAVNYYLVEDKNRKKYVKYSIALAEA